MTVLERVPVPTGDILVVQGEQGKLECLSIGDYGKHVNLTEQPVPDGLRIMPLTEKWVITVSTQYGCSMRCSFCDVPKVGPGRNATLVDLLNQVRACRHLHPGVMTKRLNIHFARMGEPTFNPAVLECAELLYANWEILGEQKNIIHPVVSTMMPRENKWLRSFLHNWAHIKNGLYEGEAGLQFSINSTDEAQRHQIFGGKAMSLADIAYMAGGLPFPKGRKYTLNFAVTEDMIIDPVVIWRLFSPRRFMVKLTPMHRTSAAYDAGLTMQADPTQPAAYAQLAAHFRKAGFETLVFIASNDEDLSKITCGNAILATGKPTL